MRSGLLFILIFLLSPAGWLLAQSNSTESLTIITYYPSPNGAFRNLEVRAKLAVGEISQSNDPAFDTINKLDTGTIYVGNSTLFKPMNTPPAAPKPGEIFYNSSPGINTLQFYNNTAWISLGG